MLGCRKLTIQGKRVVNSS